MRSRIVRCVSGSRRACRIKRRSRAMAGIKCGSGTMGRVVIRRIRRCSGLASSKSCRSALASRKGCCGTLRSVKCSCSGSRRTTTSSESRGCATTSIERSSSTTTSRN